jgi:hypothetical protein
MDVLNGAKIHLVTKKLVCIFTLSKITAYEHTQATMDV